MVFYKFLPIGFILSLITIHFFNYIFVKYKQSQRIYYIVVYYIVSISIIVFWVVISFNNFGILKEGIGAAIARAFLLSSIILYAPYFLYVIIFTHLYFLSLVNKFEKQLLKQQSLETQLNYQQLKNQLSPHFLFNNINVLTSLIEEDSKKAVEFSEKLSNIYRYFLEQEKQDVVVLRDELTFTKDYLELLQTRFENGLEFNISINKEYQNKFIVSTTLQQVLENVVKHNEISAEFPVTIRMYILDDYLVIENDIKPKLSEVKSSLNGIRNIKLRYSFFTDKKVLINQTKDFYKIKIPLLTV